MIVAVNCLFLELIAYGFYRVKFGDYSREGLQLERVSTIRDIRSGPVFTGKPSDRSSVDAQEKSKEIIHPYAGYTVDGRTPTPGCVKQKASDPLECQQRILRPEDSPMPKRDADSLNVALLGGSVAVGTVNGATPKLYQTMLSQLPEYQGRKVVLHMLAAGGYRQPQPLMLLNYYQTLGAEYDLVIALDGFNEIAIAGSEYKRHKIHPSFPRSWKFRVSGKVSTELIGLQAEKVALENKHVGRANLFSNIIARNSVAFNLLWKVLHSNFIRNVGEVSLQSQHLQAKDDIPDEFQFEGLGPNYDFSDWENLFAYSATLWANSTLLTHSSAQVHGGRFFHFIQPNQYIEGAKPQMPAVERAVAIAPAGKGGYGNWYKKGYSYLKKEQDRIRKMGVNSVDLTYLYKDEVGDIYIDSCCHVNSKGSDMIIQAIVDEIHRFNVESANLSPPN